MITHYRFGFKFNGILFGFNKKKLYRLPQMIGLRFYPLKEVPLRIEHLGGSEWRGYLLRGKRRSIHQIKSMVITIDVKIEEVLSDDCPF